MGSSSPRTLLQGAKVAASSPLGRKVTAHFPFSRDVRSVVRGRPGTPTIPSGGPYIAPGPHGKFLQGSGSGSLNTGILPAQLGMAGSAPRTVIVDFFQGDYSGGKTLFSFGDSSGQGHTQFTLLAASNYRTVQLATYGDDASYSPWTGDGTGARVFLAISYDGNVTITFRSYAAVMTNAGAPVGVQFKTSTYTLSAPLATGNTVPLVMLGGGTYGFASYDQALYGATFFNACLTPAEIDSFYRDRSRIMDPAPRFPYAAAIANASASSAVTIGASVAAETASGNASSISLPTAVASSAGTVAAAGNSAAISLPTAISGTQAAAASAGLAAQITSPTNIAASSAGASNAGLAAGITSGSGISAGEAGVAASGLTASVSLPTSIATGEAQASAAGAGAAVYLPTNIGASEGTASATGLAIAIAGSTSISASEAGASNTGLAANISGGASIGANPAAAAASGLAASLVLPTTIAAGKAGVVAAGLPIALAGSTSIAAGEGHSTDAGLAAAITQPTVVGSAGANSSSSPSAATSTTAGFQATLLTPVVLAAGLAQGSSAGLAAAVTDVLPPLMPNPKRTYAARVRARVYVAQPRVRQL